MSYYVIALVFLSTTASVAQTASDPLAVAIGQKTFTVLQNGTTISDVTITATATSTLSSPPDVGTVTFRSLGNANTRIDTVLGSGTRADVRTMLNGVPSGSWQVNGSAPQNYVQHNCWGDPAWFFPALSSISHVGDPSFVFQYIGKESRGNLTVYHLRASRLVANDTSGIFRGLSSSDVYIDSSSFLPVAIRFATHPDDDMGVDILNEVVFSSYQSVSGLLVPFHIQRFLNGGLILDISVSNVTLNSGLATSTFSLQ